MKKFFKQLLAVALLGTALTVNAQDVNTTSMLEMAPYRHQINPAWEPITDGYFYFPFLSHIKFYAGNNSLAMSDVIFKQNGTTMWAINPLSEKNLLSAFRKTTLIRGNADLALLGFGFRLKNDAYLHINSDIHVDGGVGLPKGLFNFLLGGGMTNKTGVNTFDLTGLGAQAQAYISLGVGYSKQQTDEWTWGFKVKLIDGIAYAGMRNKDLALNASAEQWALKGDGRVNIAAPLSNFPNSLNPDDINSYLNNGDYLPDGNIMDMVKQFIKPAGIGFGVDLGATYQPHEMVKLSLSLTDVGMIYWMKGHRYNYSVNMVYDGIGDLEYNQFVNDEGKFDTNALADTVVNKLTDIYENGFTSSQETKKGFASPLTGRLNAGVDAYFWDNRVGLGLYSSTMLYNAKLYEELTIGAALRPCTWFNFAVSYSMINGKAGNLGAALGLRGGPFALTLAADYVPTTWAKVPYTDGDGNPATAPIPYKTKGVNVELGLNIVWGWKNKDKDKDGVLDKFDLCPGTPKGVAVDEFGCPFDNDGDGVPDYLDQCPGTPQAAYGLTDANGCPIDTDGDGVPDYLDECPQTDTLARGKVDEKGCALDTDGDGVPDYLDECPNTPAEARGFIDAKGCETDEDGDGVPDWRDECLGTPVEAHATIDEKGCAKDTDGDGVEDWKDECPDTPEGARGFVDEKGCLLDTDGDGVYDYLDECPNTPAEAKGFVDAKGCEKDSDGDGVPDWKDECPKTPAGAKGFVDEKGCEIDTDGDGVADWCDKCPEIAGDKDNKGCPAMKKETTNIFKKAMQGIQFESGKAIIKPTSYSILDQVAQVFIENPTYYAEVQGHTDNVGKPEMNKKLSQQRAEAVREYLIKKGVAAERLTAMGYGDERPIADNKTKAGKAKNRRVEFDIEYKEVIVEEIKEYADPVPVDSTTIVPTTATDSTAVLVDTQVEIKK